MRTYSKHVINLKNIDTWKINFISSKVYDELCVIRLKICNLEVMNDKADQIIEQIF